MMPVSSSNDDVLKNMICFLITVNDQCITFLLVIINKIYQIFFKCVNPDL